VDDCDPPRAPSAPLLEMETNLDAAVIGVQAKRRRYAAPAVGGDPHVAASAVVAAPGLGGAGREREQE